jgi:hypothetical protein
MGYASTRSEHSPEGFCFTGSAPTEGLTNMGIWEYVFLYEDDGGSAG